MNADQVTSDREPTRAQIKRWRKHLAEERMEARTYRDLSERRTGEERAVLLQLEEAERRHEEYWLARLGENALPAPKPPLRTRAASLLAHLFGTIFILAMAQRAEQRSSRDVDDDVPAHMQADEHIHAEVIRSLAAKSREPWRARSARRFSGRMTASCRTWLSCWASRRRVWSRTPFS